LEPDAAPDMQFLARGELLLTANRRLARHLRARMDAAHEAAGHAAWEAPEVLPLSAWIERTWAADWPEEALLAAPQAEAAWERVVDERRHGTDLIDLGPLVRHAAEAHRLCREWDVPFGADTPFLSREARVFLDWRAGFEALCAAHRWTDRSGAVERLIGRFADGAIAPPTGVHLAGFDQVPAQSARLLETLRNKGTEVRTWEAPRFPETRVRRVAAADPDAEMEIAARWTRGLLERGEPGPIGIVCPHLEEVRLPLARVLRDQLAPGAVRGAVRGGEAVPVNVSLGEPLARTPSVATALALLAVDEGPAGTATVCALLRSPALEGAEVERDARARLAVRVAERGGPAVTLARVRTALEAWRVPAPRLDRLLAGWIGALGRQGGRRRPSEWARSFAKLLNDLGWPGERPGSAAWQAVEKWHEVLGALAGLDAVAGVMARGDALRRLESLARRTTHQPEGPETAVQVMGTLEAAGLGFRHLWVMGMADTVWPPPPAPNPFIPFALQRVHGLPGATAEVQLEHARRVTARLLAAAPDVVVSHPAAVEDRKLSISPLVAHLEVVESSALGLAPDRSHVRAIHAARPAPETLDDAQAPPLAEGEAVTGGVAVFADQARCPFRAFGYRRLAAKPVAEPHAGLDPMERGTTAHRIMEAVWLDLRDHATLAALSDDALAQRLAPLARRVVDDYLAERPASAAFAGLEAARLVRMAVEWLAQERERAPFAVERPEMRLEAEVGGVPVRLQVDRIDRLADGGTCLIDYKTGAADPKEWFGPRPTAPQLPLYAIALDETPAAVAYASLKRGAMGFSGVHDPDGAAGPRGVKAPEKLGGAAAWDAVLASWRAVLAALGEDFRAGRAAVDPKDEAVCTYCDLPPLCRIDEVRSELGLESGDDA
jgi:ATP-dependent helicase/nuclease subunit B